MISVIMAGGVGERFWPCSRRRSPKQLIDLTGKGSMISLTLERVASVSRPDEIFILTNVQQLDEITRDVGDRVPRENIVGEPVGRNTAPSIGLAAVLVERRFGDRPFMVLPADHIIGDVDRYLAAVRAADAYASEHDALLTFGITPSRPETGYGYIRAGRPLTADGTELYEVVSFHEKPTTSKALAYLEDGNFYWNSGMFVWRPSVIRAAIDRCLPELTAVLTQVSSRLGTEELPSVLKSLYQLAPAVSIDYGVMEKADRVVVVKGDFYWNDVGNWESVRDLYPADASGNVAVGDHVIIDGKDNTIFSPRRLVGVVGVTGVVVVDSDDALLVCSRDRTQDVRDIVKKLKNGHSDLT